MTALPAVCKTNDIAAINGVFYIGTAGTPCTWNTWSTGNGTGSGTVMSSPQFSLFYQPTPGSSATAQGDPNFTTDGKGHVHVIQVNVGNASDFTVLNFTPQNASTLTGAGQIYKVSPSLSTGVGSGYVVGDVLTIVQPGASGGTVTVSAVTGAGAITAFTPNTLTNGAVSTLGVTSVGTGYSTAQGLATTGGTGTAATVDIIVHVVGDLVEIADAVSASNCTTGGGGLEVWAQWSGTAWLCSQALPGTVVQSNQGNTYSAGATQIFTSSTTTPGFGFAGVSADPSAPSGGQGWYRTDLNRVRFFANSANQSLAWLSDIPTLPTSDSVANTTLAIASGTQGANSCSSTATVTMANLTTSMVVLPGYSANPASLTGWGSTGGMVLQIWPSAANTATYQVCNESSSSITYSAITFNLGAK
jgi:hypothetical protein